MERKHLYNVLSRGDVLVRAEDASSRVATLHGGGLSSTKTVSVGGSRRLGHFQRR